MPAEPGYGTPSDFKYLPMDFKLQIKQKVENFLEKHVIIVKNRYLHDTIVSLIKSMIEFNDEFIIIQNRNQVIEDISLHNKYRKVKFIDIFPELDFLND